MSFLEPHGLNVVLLMLFSSSFRESFCITVGNHNILTITYYWMQTSLMGNPSYRHKLEHRLSRSWPPANIILLYHFLCICIPLYAHLSMSLILLNLFRYLPLAPGINLSMYLFIPQSINSSIWPSIFLPIINPPCPFSESYISIASLTCSEM